MSKFSAEAAQWHVLRPQEWGNCCCRVMMTTQQSWGGCKCHSGLGDNVTANSWARITGTENKTSKLRSWAEKWRRRLQEAAGFPHTGPQWGCTTRLSNFYKSSSAQQEKTRPVAILSTSLQPHFRFLLNATCAVWARSRSTENTLFTNLAFIHLKGFFPPLCAVTWRCSWNRIGNIWAISGWFLCQKKPWKKEEKGWGGRRGKRWFSFSFLSSQTLQKPKMMGCSEQPERLSLLSHQTSGCSHSVSLTTPGLSLKTPHFRREN